MVELGIITEYYGDRTAERSKVPLINHIKEGLLILRKIGASDLAKRAYCLHPMIQSDEELSKNFFKLRNLDTHVVICVMEYRSVANEYLSKRQISNRDEIRLSPLKDVNDMLRADKIQNRKDFELYHKDTHERSKELDIYFKNWLTRLGVSEELYKDCLSLLSRNSLGKLAIQTLLDLQKNKKNGK